MQLNYKKKNKATHEVEVVDVVVKVVVVIHEGNGVTGGAPGHIPQILAQVSRL